MSRSCENRSIAIKNTFIFKFMIITRKLIETDVRVIYEVKHACRYSAGIPVSGRLEKANWFKLSAGSKNRGLNYSV